MPSNAAWASPSQVEAKKAINAYYDEYGFMNKIYACEALSQVLNKVYAEIKGVDHKKLRYYFGTEIFSKNFYKELEAYSIANEAEAKGIQNDPLTLVVYRTFSREYYNWRKQLSLVNGKISSDPELSKKWKSVSKNCTYSSMYFVLLQGFKREDAITFQSQLEYARGLWNDLFSENPAPQIVINNDTSLKTKAGKEDSINTSPVKQSSHERCINAKDYSGCVNLNSK